MNKVIIICCLLIPAFASAVGAQSYDAKPVRKPVELVFGREKLGNVPTLEVVINGKARSFYFDSGGGVSAISPALAKEIGCVPFGGQAAYNAGGAKFTIKRCENVMMNIGGYAVKKDVTVFDPMPFFPNAKGLIEGSIALDAFDNQVITIDLIKNRLRVETEKSFKNRIKDMKPLASRLSREVSGFSLDVFVAANTPKGKIWMLLDTGNTNKMLFTSTAQEILGVNLKSETGEKLTKPVKLDLVGLGSVEADSRERDMIYEGMLSYEVIEKMLFTIDFQTGRMWAKLNR